VFLQVVTVDVLESVCINHITDAHFLTQNTHTYLSSNIKSFEGNSIVLHLCVLIVAVSCLLVMQCVGVH
jgi:hypothetical protein